MASLKAIVKLSFLTQVLQLLAKKELMVIISMGDPVLSHLQLHKL